MWDVMAAFGIETARRRQHDLVPVAFIREDNKLLSNEWPLEAQGLEDQPTGRRFHVLVVHDDTDIGDRLCALLRIWGYQSEACSDATDGLRLASQLHPDCLVVDADMPGLVSHTLARELRMRPGFDDVTLVALSFHPDDEHVRFARDAAFDFHFIKPMTKRLMRRRLMGALSGQVQLEDMTEHWV
jgi:DNA-binding response OmpR family regulator